MSDNKLVLTPAAVNKYIKSILEDDNYLRSFFIEGEISNLKCHSNGNFYFSIKDAEAQINCVMFKNYVINMSFKPVEGNKVELSGSIYENIKTGFYSINVRTMEMQGVGDLSKQFNELKYRLQTEGLFDQQHKKEIPKFNKTIAVVTSPTSAAVLDITTTIKRRFPLAQVIIIPTLVQGQRAAKNIVDNIKRANSINNVDVIIVGRGGGSIEDLWAFNEEIVARAVYESKKPIISCVGHETDITIIDYVSDLRAPTPTAAAEMATENIEELTQTINTNIFTISKIINDKIEYKKMQLSNIKQNQYFLDPLLQKRLNLDNLNNIFEFKKKDFKNNISTSKIKLENLLSTIISNQNQFIVENKKSINSIHNQLDNLNPLNIMSRGFAYATVNEKLVKSIDDIIEGDVIDLKVVDGTIKASVIRKEYDE
ncbi:MAG: exodeoxyribonuclease VII large subunit [Mycoplasmatales bacterium]